MKDTLPHPVGSKSAVREEALQRRDAIPFAVRRAKGAAIRERLFGLEAFGAAQRVLFYASFRSEAPTEDMIRAAMALGKEVLLPKVDEENCALTKHIINGMHEVSPGYMGIPEPTSEQCVRVEEIDLILVPGVAFDGDGWRVGYGGGYYDRLLPRVKGSRPVVALAYEEQITESLPHEAHDVAMDMIITDRRIIECHGQG